MKRMKGVITMKGFRGVVVLAVSCSLAGSLWGQGSRPVTTQAAASKDMGSTVFGVNAQDESVAGGRADQKASRVRAPKRDPWRRDVADVEFLDSDGRVVRRLHADGNKTMALIPDEDGRCVVAVEDTGDSVGAQAQLRYYDSAGTERWSANVCCPPSGMVDLWVVVAGNGSAVAVLDRGEEEGCEMGESIKPAPTGCMGLRIFTADGRTAYQAVHATEVSVSPRGQYAIYVYREKDRRIYVQVDVPRGKAVQLPVPEGNWPSRIARDDGVVGYGRKPGFPRHRYVPGEGIKRIEER